MTIVVTPCSEKKNRGRHKAIDLYKSGRIKAIHNKLRGTGVKLCILSAKYGLVLEDEMIEYYERKMDIARAKKLSVKVAEKLRKLGVERVVFFPNWGEKNPYVICVKEACQIANIKLVLHGKNILGGIKKLLDIIN